MILVLTPECGGLRFQGLVVIGKVLWKPIGHQVFSQGWWQKFLRLRRAEQFFSNRLRRAWARDFPGSEDFQAPTSSRRSERAGSSSSSSVGSGGGRTAAPASLSAAVSRPLAADAARRERSGVAIGFSPRR